MYLPACCQVCVENGTSGGVRHAAGWFCDLLALLGFLGYVGSCGLAIVCLPLRSHFYGGSLHDVVVLLRLPERGGDVCNAAARGHCFGACLACVVSYVSVVLGGDTENPIPALREKILLRAPRVVVSLPTCGNGADRGVCHGKVIQWMRLR